ncbi:MAG TPA: hypothetical protein VK774_00230 [Solirubrobacteraceae bacterium]|nr:hypothetical protein [Solirubrobacteraceae bacterium]
MSPRRLAWIMGAGRAALGLAIVVAPREVTGGWLGRENVEHPIVARLAMMLGGRDLGLGLASLQTLDDPIAGPRVLAACALVDSIDTVATLLARRSMPRAGVLAATIVGGASAAGCLYCSRSLRLTTAG